MSREITARALRGDRFDDLGIVDIHCHYKNSYNYYQQDMSMAEMVRSEAQVGIGSFCVCPIAALESDYKLGNRQSLEFVKAFPENVYAYVALNPHYADEVSAEMERYYGEERFIGVKLHPSYHRAPITHHGYRAALNEVARRGGFVLAHSWEGNAYCGIDMFERVISDYPGVNIVMAHSGGTATGVKKAVRLLNMYANAYMDMSGFDVTAHWVNELVAACPPHKLLFGSDFPYHDVYYAPSRILFADLEDDVKLRLLGGNFRDLLASSQKK